MTHVGLLEGLQMLLGNLRYLFRRDLVDRLDRVQEEVDNLCDRVDGSQYLRKPAWNMKHARLNAKIQRLHLQRDIVQARADLLEAKQDLAKRTKAGTGQ